MDLNQQLVDSLHPNTDKDVIMAKSDNSKIWVLPYDSKNSLDFLSDACDCSDYTVNFYSSILPITRLFAPEKTQLILTNTAEKTTVILDHYSL